MHAPALQPEHQSPEVIAWRRGLGTVDVMPREMRSPASRAVAFDMVDTILVQPEVTEVTQLRCFPQQLDIAENRHHDQDAASNKCDRASGCEQYQYATEQRKNAHHVSSVQPSAVGTVDFFERNVVQFVALRTIILYRYYCEFFVRCVPHE